MSNNSSQSTPNWSYFPSWIRKSIPFSPQIFQNQNILIITGITTITEEVIKWIAKFQHTKLIDYQYTTDFYAKENLVKLFRKLKDENKFPSYIICSFPSKSSSPDCLFSQLINLFQVLAEEGDFNQMIKISFISYGTYMVLGNECIQPVNSLLVSQSKVAIKEIDTLSYSIIDLEPHQLYKYDMPLFDSIMSDLLSIKNIESAYRGGYRWVPKYEPVNLIDHNFSNSLLKIGGVYLITGGLGGIGTCIAKYLIERWEASVILVSRRKLPDIPSLDNIKDIKDLELKKALQYLISSKNNNKQNHLILSADVSNFQQMQEVYRLSCQHFGKINGIIHAAGVPGAGLIQLKNSNTPLETVFKPKVDAMPVFEKLIQPLNLDFFLAFSSTSAFLCEIGQADYAAANAFLDAYTYKLGQELGIRAISINWGPWGEIGMAVNVKKQYQAANLDTSNETISNEQGIKILEAILKSNLNHIIVSPSNLEQILLD